jgi:ABC-2 type transport system ATP-binding protein
MLSLISRLAGFGINVIVSSHVLTDIEQTCDWVVMLDGGRVLRSGPISGLEVTGTIEVELLDEPSPAVRALEALGAEVTVEGHRLLVQMANGDPFVAIRDALVTTGAGLRSLGVRSTSLEDIFLEEGQNDR